MYVTYCTFINLLLNTAEIFAVYFLKLKAAMAIAIARNYMPYSQAIYIIKPII